MNVAEYILVFVGGPLAVILVVALLIFVPAGRNRRPRYKPGQPWDHEPIWFEPHPEGGTGEQADGHGAAVPGAGTLAIGSSMYGEPTDGHAPAHGATAAAPIPSAAAAGPLGGARGTW
jgi:hypothetical protein